MQKQKEKLKKEQLLWILIAVVTGMVIILAGVYGFMQGTEPPEQTPTEPEQTQPSSYYDPADFQLDENGFMTCLTADYATGIDVSFYQGEVDWQQVRSAGVEFVFIRVGSRGTTEGKLYEDEKAQQYYKDAKAAGLKIGAYFYSQAVTPKEAEEEAWFVLQKIADWQLDLPVAYDWEWGGEGSRTDNMDKQMLTRCCLSFCEIIKNAGLSPILYFNSYQGIRQMELEKLQDIPFWLAMYDAPMEFPYRVDYWQYTASGTVPGIEGIVDLNIFLPVQEELVSGELE